MEVLSPAGNFECLKAAVLSGADAVYISGKQFGARKNAPNFDNDDLLNAIKYCKRRNVKVYITVNTLVKENEFDNLKNYLKFLSSIGPDALIIQDMGVFNLVKEACPDIPLHASTQMSVHNLSGAKKLKDLGFKRVVLARELSMDEISNIKKNVDIELEVFVHGALCMCYSGGCYLSAIIGQKSGNRGLCAQPCRLPYNSSYPLSLKDLCLIDKILILEKIGVESLKIEGRMKSKEYVAKVTSSYKKAVLKEKFDTKKTVNELADIFSRGGFTDGYFTGKRLDMFGTKQKTQYQDYKNAIKDLSCFKENFEYKRYKISFEITAKKDEKIMVKAFDNFNYSSVFNGDKVEGFKTRPTTKDDIEKAFSKLGNTPFEILKIDFNIDDDIYISQKYLNEIRRTLCENILLYHENSAKKYNFKETQNNFENKKAKTVYSARFYDIKNIPDNIDTNFIRKIWLGYYSVINNLSILKKLLSIYDCGIILPRIISDNNMPNILKTLKELGVKDVMVSNIGHIDFLKQNGFNVFGDYALNVFNNRALSFYESEKLKNVTLSFEMSLNEIKKIANTSFCSLIVYGSLPLMHFKNCIIKNQVGCINKNGVFYLKDRLCEKFPVLCDFDCTNTLYNSKTLAVWDMKDKIENLGLSSLDLMFVFETKDEINDVISAYKNGKINTPNKKYTRGLYLRSVL